MEQQPAGNPHGAAVPAVTATHTGMRQRSLDYLRSQIPFFIYVVVLALLVSWLFMSDSHPQSSATYHDVPDEVAGPPSLPNLRGRGDGRRSGAANEPNDAVDTFFRQAGNFRCPQTRLYTRKEIATHTTGDNLWIVIDGNVLDVSMFISHHPGGALLLEAAGGEDAALLFSQYHHPSSVQLFLSFCIGRVKQE